MHHFHSCYILSVSELLTPTHSIMCIFYIYNRLSTLRQKNTTGSTHLNIMLNSRSESSDTPLWLLHKVQPHWCYCYTSAKLHSITDVMQRYFSVYFANLFETSTGLRNVSMEIAQSVTYIGRMLIFMLKAWRHQICVQFLLEYLLTTIQLFSTAVLSWWYYNTHQACICCSRLCCMRMHSWSSWSHCCARPTVLCSV